MTDQDAKVLALATHAQAWEPFDLGSRWYWLGETLQVDELVLESGMPCVWLKSISGHSVCQMSVERAKRHLITADG